MKKLFTTSIMFFAIIGLSASAQTAYITNYNGGTVSIFDITTNTVISTIPAGTNPFGVSATKDGSKVYISNYGDGTVDVINTATNTVTATITVGSSLYGIDVTPDGSKVYVAQWSASTVSVINTATNTVSAIISVGDNPYGLAVTPDGSKVYVANYNSNSVSVINTATNTVTATIPVGTNPEGVAVTPDGSQVYITNYYGQTVSAINTTTNTVTATITVGVKPYGVTVSPDGSNVYVADRASYLISVISTATNTVTHTIKVCADPSGESFSPDGSRLYVANYGCNTVEVVNTTTYNVYDTVYVGAGPTAFGNFISFLPHPFINSSGNVTICKGNDTTICVNAIEGTPPYRYLWSNGDTSSCQIVSPINTITYSATVTDANSYTATSSLTVTVDTVAIPVITSSGSMLFSTAGSSYQWNLSGNPISGATGQFYAPLCPGVYSVTVKYPNGCSATSATTVVTGINELNNSLNISICPNPVIDNLQILTSLPIKKVEITDITGRPLYTTNAKSIDCSNFAKGVYFIRVTLEKGVAVKKFVKE